MQQLYDTASLSLQPAKLGLWGSTWVARGWKTPSVGGCKKQKVVFLMELDKTDVSTRWLRSKNLGFPTFQKFLFFGEGVAHMGL